MAQTKDGRPGNYLQILILVLGRAQVIFSGSKYENILILWVSEKRCMYKFSCHLIVDDYAICIADVFSDTQYVPSSQLCCTYIWTYWALSKGAICQILDVDRKKGTKEPIVADSVQYAQSGYGAQRKSERNITTSIRLFQPVMPRNCDICFLRPKLNHLVI